MSSNKKIYVQPSVEVLGSVAEKTQNGTVFPSDDGQTIDTANPLGGS